MLYIKNLGTYALGMLCLRVKNSRGLLTQEEPPTALAPPRPSPKFRNVQAAGSLPVARPDL